MESEWGIFEGGETEFTADNALEDGFASREEAEAEVEDWYDEEDDVVVHLIEDRYLDVDESIDEDSYEADFPPPLGD